MVEIRKLQADFEAAKKLVIDASYRIFALENQIKDLKMETPEQVKMFVSVVPGEPKEKHSLVIIGNQESTQGTKKILELYLSTGSLEKTRLGEWVQQGIQGSLFIPSIRIVMSNGDIYEECWPLSVDQDGSSATLKLSYSRIQ